MDNVAVIAVFLAVLSLASSFTLLPPASIRLAKPLHAAFFEEELPITASTGVNAHSIEGKSVTTRRRDILKKTGLSLLSLLAVSSGLPHSASAKTFPGSPIVYCGDDVMSKKSHGTTDTPLDPAALRWNIDAKLADKICSFNRHFAEPGGSFENNESFLKEVSSLAPGETITYYDTVSQRPLFVAPVGRTKEQFLQESYVHGWPSFRDSEVVWENTRILKSTGETVSVTGTHLGHNLPDKTGNRYCINLVSVAGVGKA